MRGETGEGDSSGERKQQGLFQRSLLGLDAGICQASDGRLPCAYWPPVTGTGTCDWHTAASTGACDCDAPVTGACDWPHPPAPVTGL